jgi:hypothetical protein
MAIRATYGEKKQLSSRYLRRETKCVICKTLVRPMLTYESESWPLKKRKNLLRIFERRILRRILWPN